MNISLNWLQQYVDTGDLSPEKIGEILTDIGLEVEGMEQSESIPGGLRGLVVGHVVECGKHPGADRLSLTQVDVGGETPLQIVCGAPNVAQGQKVVVATVGTELHPTEGEPFKIKKGKIRGEVSEGMICAEDEIGTGTSHDGILVLDADTKIGTPAAEIFHVTTDTVYEIGLTPNRSDATAHMGVARDLAAALKINYSDSGRGTGEVQTPDVSGFRTDTSGPSVDVEVRDTDACPRYSGVVLTNITVGESPDWLKNRLRAVGVRPISNVVDVTNFVLHELGQPLHAFDLEKIGGQKIIVETLPAGTKFHALDEQTYELTDTDLMICDGNETPMCIGGVFGGSNSGVTNSTTSIFLESAHFNAKSIRRTSFHHDLRTDAAKVFEKGSDPNLTVYALKRAVLLLEELAGAKATGELVDIYPNIIMPLDLRVSYRYVNRLIGVEIPRERMFEILDALHMEPKEVNADTFAVSVPTDKADVTRPADVVEEILRIYGLNEVPIPNQIRAALTYGEQPDPVRAREVMSEMLVGSGFYEIMAQSLTESRYFREIFTDIGADEFVHVNNTSSVTLDILRPSMLFSGLEAVLHNANRRRTNVKLFELGRTYRTDTEGNPTERNHLTLFVTGRERAEGWRDGEQPSDFYTLKRTVQKVLQRFGLENFQTSETEAGTLQYGLKHHRGQQTLVEYGRVKSDITAGMGLKQEVFYADFDWDNLLRALGRSRVKFEEPGRFPTARRDLALVIDHSVKFQDIAAIAHKTGKKLLQRVHLFDVFEDEDKLGAGKRSYAVSFLFEDKTRTLKDKDLEKVMNQLTRTYESKLGATIRR